jgi:ElaB/YqjD/DUF883 family membrane-anchored ribosome-binding protein
MDDSGNASKLAGDSTSGATKGAGTSAADIAEEEKAVADRVRELAEKTSQRAGMLADDARDVISENPWGSTLTVFVVGLMAGTLLGVLLSRE